MNFEQAKLLRDSKSSMIGSIDAKGFTIDEILIIPSSEELRQRFFITYLYTMDAEKSLEPFLQDDLDVWAIDKKHLQEANILFYDKLNKDEIAEKDR